MNEAAAVAAIAAVIRPVIRREDIEGAPFALGVRVRVCCVVDETTDASWVGKTGYVEHYEYDCGCGQTYPHDPMIGVRFPDGAVEEFWAEELEENDD